MSDFSWLSRLLKRSVYWSELGEDPLTDIEMILCDPFVKHPFVPSSTHGLFTVEFDILFPNVTVHNLVSSSLLVTLTGLRECRRRVQVRRARLLSCGKCWQSIIWDKGLSADVLELTRAWSEVGPFVSSPGVVEQMLVAWRAASQESPSFCRTIDFCAQNPGVGAVRLWSLSVIRWPSVSYACASSAMQVLPVLFRSCSESSREL